MHEQLMAMRALVERHADAYKHGTVVPRIAIHLGRAPTRPAPTLYQPMLCLVLQGAKQVMIGDRLLRYDPASYFIASVELPATGCVLEASPEHPYMAVSMALDRPLLAELLSDIPMMPEGHTAGFAVSAVTPQLLGSFLRLLELLDAPDDAAVLAPLLEREILYRLLKGEQGGLLRQIARADSRLSQIRQAIGRIRTHYDEPLRIDALAELAGMSTASFHRHFKAATAMSPLQYQKTLRLQQARRLLVVNADAQRTAYTVGYESASQFSREYARMFGNPPGRDAERLRAEDVAVGEVAVAVAV
jgi:AraC-like DNA-binding protein